MQHVARKALLCLCAVNVEPEAYALRVKKLVFRHPVAYAGRAVEAFRHVPRLAILRQFVLKLACRKVNSHRKGVVVAGRKAHGHRLSQLADANHQLGFILDTAQMVGNKKRFMAFQKA